MSLEGVESTTDGFRAALGTFASGVNVITMWDETGRPHGATVTAFSSVSMDPLLVLVCVNRAAKSYERICETRRLGINILGSIAQEVSDYCAVPGTDKELNRDWLSTNERWKSPALAGAVAYLDCEVDQIVEAGTHGVVICAVESIGLSADLRAVEPLLHFRGSYRQLGTLATRGRPRPLPIILEDAL